MNLLFRYFCGVVSDVGFQTHLHYTVYFRTFQEFWQKCINKLNMYKNFMCINLNMHPMKEKNTRPHFAD